MSVFGLLNKQQQSKQLKQLVLVRNINFKRAAVYKRMTAFDLEVPPAQYRPHSWRAILTNWKVLKHEGENLFRSFIMLRHFFTGYGGSIWTASYWNKKAFQQSLAHPYIALNQAIADRDLKSVEKNTWSGLYKQIYKEYKATSLQLPPQPSNDGKEIKFYYRFERPVVNLLSFAVAPIREHSFGLATIRIRGLQTAYIYKSPPPSSKLNQVTEQKDTEDTEKEDKKDEESLEVLGGSTKAVPVDEIVDLYYFHYADQLPTSSADGSSGLPSVHWRVRGKEKYKESQTMNVENKL